MCAEVKKNQEGNHAEREQRRPDTETKDLQEERARRGGRSLPQEGGDWRDGSAAGLGNSVAASKVAVAACEAK